MKMTPKINILFEGTSRKSWNFLVKLKHLSLAHVSEVKKSECDKAKGDNFLFKSVIQ